MLLEQHFWVELILSCQIITAHTHFDRCSECSAPLRIRLIVSICWFEYFFSFPNLSEGIKVKIYYSKDIFFLPFSIDIYLKLHQFNKTY